MKLTAIFLLIGCMHLAAAGYSQGVTLKLKDAPLEKLFAEIKKQTGYVVFYDYTVLKEAKPITVDVKNVTLEQLLTESFKQQPLTFTLEGKTILVTRKIVDTKHIDKLNIALPIDVKGKVTNEDGIPIAGANVLVKGTNKVVTTDGNGDFMITDVPDGAELEITFVGYERKIVTVRYGTPINTSLAISSKELDVAIVQAYGITTRRLSTSNIARVSGNDIIKQPVSNPLATLQGRVPGLIITPTSGLNGAGIKIQIRGQNSLVQGSDPLFIIDGVPFSPGNNQLNQLSNATNMAGLNTGLSPFNLINPADIESIEILKDADATAIYGSQGANGVILITTRKGKAGKTKVNFNTYTGWSTVTKTNKLLNTQQYIQMRREAFSNDGITPSSNNAPDIFLWDTARYTDLSKLLIGGTARTTDAQLSVSGGSTNTQFFIGGGYHKETTVMPTDLSFSRASVHLNLNHFTVDKKFAVSLSSIFGYNDNSLPITDLAGFTNYAPNMKLYDSAGNLNWQENGISYRSLGFGSYANPLAALKEKVSNKFRNLLTNLSFNYRITSDLNVKTSFGYNQIDGDEAKLSPTTSIDPFSNTLPYASFATSSVSSWIIEPQLEFSKSIAASKINILIGSTWRENKATNTSQFGSNYSSDLLLGSISGAGVVINNTNHSQYKYAALFGRVNSVFNDKYIINITGRRDGSSRFGPQNRFNNFGAAGLAWIFSQENFFKSKMPFISYGKLRGSYGTTGNDQLGDYKFLDTWGSSPTTFQQSAILLPSGLFNPNLAWETNKKLEAALDLGLINDRILFSVAYFKNKSGNQLISYALPSQTGFPNISKNIDAVIQNKGLEFTLTSKIVQSSKLRWSTIVNLTVSRNRLIDFPGLATSSYANSYVIGKPLSVVKAYEFSGVNSSTGIYSIRDIDSNGIYNNLDRVALVNIEPVFYGGMQNLIEYNGFEIDIFFEFRKQTGVTNVGAVNTSGVPGVAFKNQPEVVSNRWRKPGDNAEFQRLTTLTSTPVFLTAANLLPFSTGAYGNASYMRCKTLFIAYNLPATVISRMKLEKAKFYFQAQNLFVLTNYNGPDPEIQSFRILPPMKTMSIGIQFTF
jgi:TonB-dependent starch-binding outer membrane protein SusC